MTLGAVWQLIAYCLLILLASLGGGLLPAVTRLTHTWTQLLMSLVAGMMLGVALLHLLPHATAEVGSLDQSILWMLGGLLAMFFLQRFFHFHQHGEVVVEGSPVGHEHHAGCQHEQVVPSIQLAGSSTVVATQPTQDDANSAHPAHRSRIPQPAVHGHDHGHSHGHSHDHGHPMLPSGGRLSWLGVALGLTIHTLMDGVALAAAVEVDASTESPTLYGLSPFVAIVLHKPLDAMAISTLMIAGGWSAAARHTVNVLFALVIPLGVLLFYLGLHSAGSQSHQIVGCALAFSAGTFLCIALSDLLPEVQFHNHDRFKLSLALLIGIALAYCIRFFEGQSHPHNHHHGWSGQPAANGQVLQPVASTAGQLLGARD